MTRRLLRSVAASLGATSICCLWIVGPLVSPSHDAIYHWSGPASTIFVPALLDFFCGWIVFAFLLFGVQGATQGSLFTWAVTILFLPWIALRSVALLLDWNPPYLTSRLLFVLCATSFFLFSVPWHPALRATAERLRKLTIDVLCITGIFGALTLIELVYFGSQALWLNRPLPLHQTTRSSTQTKNDRPRIIWIVLDELSYQQVYGHRSHTLSLPAFDRLAKQSTVFTKVVPAGIMTEIVLPSLMSGVPADQTQPSSNEVGLKIHNPVTKRWQTFNPHDTIFSDALTAGYSTAIAGWYNPYCRFLPEVLDRCFWTFSQPAPNKMMPQGSIADNLLDPIVQSSGTMNYLLSTIIPKNKLTNDVVEMHISDYRQISDSADQMLQNSGLDFLLIHMSIPHPGGIYNRATHTFTTHKSTYLDNLALADSYLAHVRSQLEARGQWDSSVIVVMGDHSWRTELLWSSTPEWTPEEQEASDGGHFDDRPAYIVKLAKQEDGSTIDTPFKAVGTRMLFDAIIDRQIVSQRDLSEWVRTLDRKQSQN